jgi:hypothetical protein
MKKLYFLFMTAHLTVFAHNTVTTKTPCPLMNCLIRVMELSEDPDADADAVSVTKLTDLAVSLGVDRNNFETLANKRAIDGNLVWPDLLDPNKTPAHKGSLARKDSKTPEEFAQIDDDRLDELWNNKIYSSEFKRGEKTIKVVSLKQLHEYKKYCWSLSDMGWLDKRISNAEVHLLWTFFAGHRVLDQNGDDALPLATLYHFLRNSSLPSNFIISDDPATLCSTFRNIF